MDLIKIRKKDNFYFYWTEKFFDKNRRSGKKKF